MVDAEILSFIAECFWPGVCEADLRELDERAQAAAAAAGGAGEEVRYLGAILLREEWAETGSTSAELDEALAAILRNG